MTNARDSQTRVLEVEALRAIAHPLRVQLLGALRTNGPATATELGERLGESSGATSYHLRQLARYGFIVDDDVQPSKRERRWRAAAMFTSWDDADFVDDPAGREASDAMHELVLRHQARRDRQWRERRATWGREWLSNAGSSDLEVRLTPEATRRLHAAIIDLAHELEAESGDAAEAAVVSIYVQAVPVHPEDRVR
jgi:DNA-binding transcriptional ArsR family regulator